VWYKFKKHVTNGCMPKPIYVFQRKKYFTSRLACKMHLKET